MSADSLRLVVFAALLVLGVAEPAWAASVVEMNDFISRSRAALTEVLTRIRAHPMTPRERYVVLDAGRGSRYVQCMLIYEDTAVFCEASSGYYGGVRPPSAPARGALMRLGFEGDPSKGNYRFERAGAEDADLWAIADRMLETLYRAYGARSAQELRVGAPLAGDLSGLAPSRANCR